MQLQPGLAKPVVPRWTPALADAFFGDSPDAPSIGEVIAPQFGLEDVRDDPVKRLAWAGNVHNWARP